MTTPAKPGPDEELIGTITASGIRLTRDTRRAQQAYRLELERAQRAPRRGLLSRLLGRRRTARRGHPRPARQGRPPLELRIAWSSDAPLRVRFAAARAMASPEGASTARTPRNVRTERRKRPDDRVMRARRDPDSTNRRSEAGRRIDAQAEGTVRRPLAAGPEKVRRTGARPLPPKPGLVPVAKATGPSEGQPSPAGRSRPPRSPAARK
jgi:hypothetical protein